jgi:hypothetical protein
MVVFVVRCIRSVESERSWIVMTCSYDFGEMGWVLRNGSHYEARKDGHLIGEFDTLNRAVICPTLKKWHV